jgi:transcription initiation factor TFIIB
MVESTELTDTKFIPGGAVSSQECLECGSAEIVMDAIRGERICSICGLVISEHLIDNGPEWRAFTSDERNKRSRVGSPVSCVVPSMGLSTMIGWENRDIYGNKLSPKKRAQIYRLRKWQIRTRSQGSYERNLSHAIRELERLSSQLGIHNGVKETAAVIYRRAIEKKLVRGRSIEAMVAASVYAGSRLRKVPRTLDEIAQCTRVNTKELGRCYRLILRELHISIPIASPVDFISRFSEELKISGKTQQRAIEILNQAKEFGITAGKDPTGLAAAALYISSITEGERRTQREIAEIARITEVTVRNRYKEIVRVLGIKIAV